MEMDEHNEVSDWLGWHFLPDDRRLRFGERKLVVPGETVRVEGTLELCEWGLHASKRAIDALQYAPGSIVSYVRLGGGDVVEGDDKACAHERTPLWMADATRTLHEFACWCAERGLAREREAGREPDARSWAGIEAKRRWLRGEISVRELAAARAAARAATWAAAGAATWAAAWVAAEAAARAAARVAAGDAAWDAARAAERAAQNAKLEEMLWALRGTAAMRSGEGTK